MKTKVKDGGAVFYKKTVLDNGITVITEHMESVRSISLGLWNKVGSRDEIEGEEGMSHFMEHMMFKGTPTRTSTDISEEFDRLGAELNAFTSKEATCYYARFVDSNLAPAIEIFADMLLNSTFTQEHINSEREVVIEEIARMEDTPDDFIHELFSASVFPTHTLGKPILGTRENVGSFTHDDCAAYRDKHYTSGNLVVAAAGNVDHDELVGLIERLFADMPEGAPAKARLIRPSFSDATPKHLAVVTKETEQAHIILGGRGLAEDDDARYALSMMDVVLGGGMSSRLFTEVREKRGLAYAVYSYAQPYGGAGQYAAYVGTRPGNAKEAIEVLLGEFKKMADAGITESELARSRDTVEGKLVLGMEATSSRMISLGKNELSGLEQLSLDERLARYNAVELGDVAQVAKRILGNELTLAVIGPYEASDFEGLL